MNNTSRLILVILALLVISSSFSTESASTQGGVPIGDAPLSDAEVQRWFNYGIVKGDGTRCELRKGNDVRELVDGPETFAEMAAAIRTAAEPGDPANPPRPTLNFLRSLGASPGDPIWSNEIGLVAEGPDGTLFTTSPQGGSARMKGSVFKVTPDGKTLKVIKGFDVTTGSGPQGGLTHAGNGTFYGTTYGGGKYSVGTIFRIGTEGGHAIVWDFRNGTVVPPVPYPKKPTPQQLLDAAGSYPVAPPVLAKNGNLYGITSYANNQQYGVLYTLAGGYRGLYLFKGDQGRFPKSLVSGSDGNLYGTTLKGDASCVHGTVFKATPSGSVSALHKFDYTRGAQSHNIAQGADGNLYGTAAVGGSAGIKAGVVYKLTLGGVYTVIHNFSGGADGGGPIAGVVHAKDGYLYGATTFGCGGNRGGIYRLRTDGTDFKIIYSFLANWSTGRHARVTPMQHSNGKLYGVTYQGGAFDKGAFYSVEVPRFVYLLGWWLTDSLTLPGQPPSTAHALFSEASAKGAQVRAMLWDSSEKLLTQNTSEVARINNLDNGAAILDDRTLNFGSHHQKILVVGGSQGLIAFCGGVDINPDRLYPKGAGANAGGNTTGAPLHDVHCRIKGPAAGDLLNIFAERWNEHPGRTNGDSKLGPVWGTRPLIPDPIPGATNWVQVGRTYGNGSKHAGIGGIRPLTQGYSFAPNGEQSAARMIIHAIGQARKFIYLEDQYFVDTAPNAKLGLDVRVALVNKLRESTFKSLTVLIPHGSITDMGPPLLKNQVNLRRKKLIDALVAAGGDKVRIFYRNEPGNPHTYIHSKTWIFDDEFAIIGSANTNRRSWTHDSEVVVGICDQGKADRATFRLPHRLRMRLWAEHLNLAVGAGSYIEKLRDAMAATDLWTLFPPDGARIAPYKPFQIIPEGLTDPDSDWNTFIDPDGS